MPVPRRPFRVAFTATIAVAAIALLGAAVLVLRDSQDGDPDITARGAGDPMLVFAEFGMNEDRLYLAAPERPTERTLLDTIAHAPGWGINPASEVAGALLAYTVLPAGAPAERDTPAELWIMDLDTRNKTRLARDADLLVAPVFIEDGAGIVYRRSEGREQQLVHLDVAAQTRVTAHAEETAFGIFPIGLDEDGALLFSRLSAAGTDVLRAKDGAEPELVFHASDDIARDFQISPDGKSVSYLAPEVVAERVAYRARVLSVKAASEQPLAMTADRAGEQYGPVWTPTGTGITVGQEALAREAEPAVVLGTDGASVEPLPAPTQGFDVPLGWSDDGRFLAVRSFDGRNSSQPGFETTVVIDSQGERYEVDVPTEVIFIGWYTGV